MSMLLFVVAAGMAVALAAIYWSEWYFIGLAAAVAALPLTAMSYLAALVGHSRSRVAIFVVGAIATLICYLGYYHVDMLGQIGGQHLVRVDLLPRYIAWRMNNDVVQDVGSKVVFNWIFFTLDLAIIGGITITAGLVVASKPYDEEKQNWLGATTVHLPPGSGRGLVASLNANNLELLQRELQATSDAASPHCAVTLYHAAEGLLATPSTKNYLAVAEVVPASGNKTAQRNEIASYWRLSDGEFAVFRDRCLTNIPLSSTAPAVSVEQAPVAVSAKHDRGLTAEAYIELVPAPYTGTVLSPKNIYISNTIGLTPIILFLVGFIGCGAAGFLSGTATAMWLRLAAAVVIGIVGICFTIWFADYLPSRFLYNALCREFALRPGKLVNLNDSGVEVIQVVPRAHWTKVMLEDAADVGLMVFDLQRQMILFEGDRERWVIPATSILSCEVVSYKPGMGKGSGEGLHFFVAALQANVGGRLWEGCINRRQISFQRRTGKVRERDAHELRAKILALIEFSR